MPLSRFLLPVALTLVAGLTACGSDGGSKSGSPTTTATGSSSTTPSTPPPVVGGRTKWIDVTAAWKTLAPGPFTSSPAQAADDLAALRRGQDTSEVGQVAVVAVRRGEPAVIVLAETGVPDPETVEIDTEITLEPGDQGWVVSKARQQSACRTAVPAGATACS